jgi:ATP-binding cassette subfamily F protein uup
MAVPIGKNILNCEGVNKAYELRPLITDLSIGISQGEKIGVVGVNGGGKSTLLKILSGVVQPDSGRVSRRNDVSFGTLTQVDDIPKNLNVGEFIAPSMKEHERRGSQKLRDILSGLFSGNEDKYWDRPIVSLSGGEKRRVHLAKLLMESHDFLFLDEPTNHLDVEGVMWLAQYLKNEKALTLFLITHDRWFLDEVSEKIWEVVDGKVEEYEGGYSAYVLAKAERARQASVENQKRNMLIKKELAWLRRGAPARTAKPKFRIEAANELINDEPPVRNQAELLSFASNRLGKRVIELQHVDLRLGDSLLINQLFWNIGPGDRIGLIGANGAGKSSFLKLLSGDVKPSAGSITFGSTVKVGFLSQHLDELDPQWRVLEAVERVARSIDLAGGRSLSASQLCEKLGFESDGQAKLIRDLSGGERRRLQLTRILMDSPNVLLLDEPTNDFDVETLTALEDLLDSFAGTLIVVSHDRYFLERVCDRFYGVMGDGQIRDLPGGIDEYFSLVKRKVVVEAPVISNGKGISNAAQTRLLKKELAKVEKQMERAQGEKDALLAEQSTIGSDHQALADNFAKLEIASSALEELELSWLEITHQLEGLN